MISERIALEISRSSAEWFLRLREFAHPIWLDSQSAQGTQGNFDLLAAEPEVLIESDGKRTKLSRGDTIEYTDASPFLLIQTELNKLDAVSPTQSCPFQGGALGYLGYDAGRLSNHLEPKTIEPTEIPQVRVGIYVWALLSYPKEQRAYLVFHPSVSAERRTRIEALLNRAEITSDIKPFHLQSVFQPNHSKQDYVTNVEKICSYISAGDCYQVNLAQRFSAPYVGDPLSAYLKLREVSPNPFGGYVDIDPQRALLCFSPERFLRVQNRWVETRPIKGTRPRSNDSVQDQSNAEELRLNLKERAENLMIVDLMRNDLGRCCVTGSVKVRELFSIESYPAVHHMVSAIEGQLSDNLSPLQLLEASLPGGSITGAPKRRAMQIIAELEPASRQAYCGTLFYLSCCGTMDSNILIRSFVADGEQMHCWAGGGIVSDSEPEAEYQETIDKVGTLLTRLEEEFSHR